MDGSHELMSRRQLPGADPGPQVPYLGHVQALIDELESRTPGSWHYWEPTDVYRPGSSFSIVQTPLGNIIISTSVNLTQEMQKLTGYKCETRTQRAGIDGYDEEWSNFAARHELPYCLDPWRRDSLEEGSRDHENAVERIMELARKGDLILYQ
jgi:hypothetical protein